MKKNKLSLFLSWSATLLIGILTWYHWGIRHSELLSFHEQNQMFLFNSDYFAERMAVAGGLADYVSEFLVQFFLHPTKGAVIMAFVMMLIQRLSLQVLRCFCSDMPFIPFLLSFFPVVPIGMLMMDENMLFSYPIALLLTLTTYLLCRRGGWLCQLVASLPLFWLAGPICVIQPGLAAIDCFQKSSWRKALVPALLLALTTVGWIYLCRTLWIAQYPWATVLAGINYHRLTRMTMEAPTGQYTIVYLFFFLSLSLLILRAIRIESKELKAIPIYLILLLGISRVPGVMPEAKHDANQHLILEQLSQVRRGDWNGIIANAEQYRTQHVQALQSPLSADAVNLALAMTGQLSSRMFEFPQVGLQGLMMPRVRDNVSNITSMEVFWQLGFINESMRYAFDSQESILNCRKSSYLMRRMAECNILNGRYDVASKYIDMLKQTLYYAHWAEIAEGYLYNEEKIRNYPEWGQKLEHRLTNDFLFYYPEMPKMLGNLVLQDQSNRLAYDYFMASLLLTGNVQGFVANLPQQPQAGVDPFPKGYKQYIEYMQTHTTSADAITGASPQK